MGPDVPFSPFWVYFLILMLALLAHHTEPVGIRGGLAPFKYLGYLVVFVSLGMLLEAYLRIVRSGTNPQPWRPTTRIVRAGSFRFSRNPIYTGMILNLIGIALVMDSLWVALGALLTAWITWYFAIQKEEAYLEEKFGEEYLAYKKDTRRWL